MSMNDNEDRWDTINAEIRALEEKEEQFIDLKRMYERSINDFHNEMHQISARKHELLQTMVNAGSRQAVQELEASQQLRRNVDVYVDTQMEVIEDVSRAMRNTFEAKREALITERDEAAWE